MTMAYRIISTRIGVPGEIWEPSEDVNIDALIDGGFVEKVSAPAPKSATKDNSNAAPDAHQNIEE
jgi:hypothetical protein